MEASATMTAALNDFKRARWQANIQKLLAPLGADDAPLLSYEEVRKTLHAVESPTERLEDIPLEAIVGSVGRYRDFTRSFLPKQDSDAQRWAGVKLAMTGLRGVPPIEVYRVGGAYFVKDGNHRVSVARQLGAKSIQAYVTDVHTRVHLSPAVQPDDLIIASEQVQFFEQTQLDKTHPEAKLEVTVPGQYEKLLEHIGVHRYYMGLDEKRDISFEEAASHWFDTVYLPVTRLIGERRLLDGFPERTETDLYVWLAEHRAALEESLGWDLANESVADDMSEQLELSATQTRSRAQASRAFENLKEGASAQIVRDLLVAIPGDDWCALEQALVVAEREGARLLGVHVVASAKERDDESVKTLRHEFQSRVDEAGVEAQLALEVGEVISVINERARFSDLVVANLVNPALNSSASRLSSGYQSFIQRCVKPVLAVPNSTTSLTSALLAYDGSDKAQEALFAATYLQLKWGLGLTVLSVGEFGVSAPATIKAAQDYIEEHGAQAEFIIHTGAVAQTIIEVAGERDAELIVMGGYKYSRLLELVFGGVIDQVLRDGERPVLILQ